MADSYYAGSYWLARQETAEACAQRAERFFRLLERCDPSWKCWTDAAAAETVQSTLVSPDASVFARMFETEDCRQGTDGFDFYLFSGDTVATASSVNVTCGSSTSAYPQACVLRLPDAGIVAARVLTAPVMTGVLRAMAVAWEPEWAVMTCNAHREMTSGKGDAGTFVGWGMYFSWRRGTVPPLPSPIRVEPVEDKGTLIILTPERFSAFNEEHAALADRVHALLKKAGLLRPLRPWQEG
jgi:hypothetical protein